MTPTPVALITGATEGIGRAVAFRLGRAGYAVGVCARDEKAVAALVAELMAEGIRAAGRRCDVGSEQEVAALVDLIVAELGPVEVLVNNAGVGIIKPIEELTLEEWDRTFATNTRSLFLTTRSVLPGMRERKRGWVINVASLAGKNGLKHGTAYSASKHAVLGFTSSLMLEVRHDGVRVASICPGSVNTSFGRAVSRTADQRARMLQPDDVAEAIAGVMALPPRALISELDLRPAAPSW